MEAKPLIFTYRCVKKSTIRFVSGEYEVRIRISQLKEKAFIPLGYSSSLEDWDEEYCLPKPSHKHYKALQKKINDYLDNIAFEIKLAERSSYHISCIEVKHRVMHKNNKTLIHKCHLKILEYFDKVINELEEAGNPGYADVFKTTRATVSKLINNNVYIPADKRNLEKDRAFLTFTQEDHHTYEKLISNGTSESTISFYLRNYYRIWNMAIKEGYISREEHHPSRFIKFHPYKRIRTKKRSIDQDYFHAILDLKFDPESRIHRSQMLLQFIYYARGINFGDMCKLPRANIANGTVCYMRSKNHREYDFILHAKALEIIEYFKSYPEQSDAGYLFPFLLSIHNNPRKINKRIDSALKDFNSDLKAMALAVGWERKFTSYSLRHGFATHLRNNKVDISIIKEALGHELEKQTIVYLDEIDDKPVADEINRALDDWQQKSKINLDK
jgi:integrase/recombinase XerD